MNEATSSDWNTPRDFLCAQGLVANLDAIAIVSIELVGHFGQRLTLEHELAVSPRQCGAHIDAMLHLGAA
jgi:hypothetical protein